MAKPVLPRAISSKAIFFHLQPIIASHCRLQPLPEITQETRLVEDLDIDSLDGVELLMEVEDRFRVELDEDTAEGCKTVGEFMSYLSRCLTNQPE